MTWLSRASAAVLLPIVAFLFGSAYYGMRSVLVIRAADAGVGSAHYATALVAGSLAAAAGAVCSALVGAAIGPSGAAALGLVVAAAAALVPPSSAVLMLAASAALGFGAGLYRPALYAAAARPWALREGAGAALVAVLAFVGFNGAAMGASPVSGWLLPRFPALVGPLGAVLFLVAAALAAGDAVVQWRAPDHPAVLRPRAIGAGFGLALVLALSSTLWSLGSDAQYTALGPTLTVSTWLYSLNPAAVVAVGLLAGVLLAVPTFLGWRVPVLLPAGLGLAVLALTIALAVPAGIAPGVALPAAVLVLGGAAEVAVPIALAAAARGVHWRVSTAVVAIPTAATSLAGALSSWLPEVPGAAFLWSAPLLVIGLVLAAVAIPLDRWLLSEEDGAAPPEEPG